MKMQFSARCLYNMALCWNTSKACVAGTRFGFCAAFSPPLRLGWIYFEFFNPRMGKGRCCFTDRRRGVRH